ncbi:glycosyltransferase [Gimesia aquarii]|uniref:Putative glycosyltransferase EpsJ n=1 Tax=Gimesia aquarii TaxID=2527964 RepID=A0A517WZS3_9PLAN|nr:glycosyltransferase [Gimesia aquarii]QDU10755.1 putative glycosyltransferase EpsJ [Gimesia aquarii]
MSTECECSQSGWCQRHNCHKPKHFFHLCQTRSDYFKMWEKGIGPGQLSPSEKKSRRYRRRLKDFSVAVVIISHNYGAFLREAIDSVLAQTYKPREILVVDDRSTDDTKEIAQSYQRQGVKYLSVDVGNVHAARGAGFEATNSEITCFLDADDRLSEDYLEKGLEQFDHYQVAVVYSDTQFFGKRQGCSNYPETYSADQLQFDNFIHAGSLALSEAIELSRVFEKQIDPLLTQGDWFLWREVLGRTWTARKQKALYHYRIHKTNWTQQMQTAEQRSYFEYAGLAHQKIMLFIPLSGRVEHWPLTAGVLERQTWPHDQISLVLMDTSQCEEFSQTVRDWIEDCDYRDVRYLKFDAGLSGLADENRRLPDIRDQVRFAMARIYNRMLRMVDSEFVWILEDDIVPPDDVCQQLLSCFDPKTVSVAAPYPSRFHKGFVVWNQAGASYEKLGYQEEVVGGNGFGCTILRASTIRDNVFTALHNMPDFDIAFYARLKTTGFQAKVNWSCFSQHSGALESEIMKPKQSSKTDCECAEPGWCERHQCKKHPHFHKLCQTRTDYFELWEKGAGPGQNLQAVSENSVESSEPGMMRKAFNFTKAVARHVTNGSKHVDEATYNTRLSTCQACEMCDTSRMVCKHKSCGCTLRVKALWDSERCPLNKWTVNPENAVEKQTSNVLIEEKI